MFRTGFDLQDTWAWFDIGPFGSSGHAHPDKLHLSLRAFGQPFLVDTGRFAYEGQLAKFRPYLDHSRAHNVILLDDASQITKPAIATQPVTTFVNFNDSNKDPAAFGSITFERLSGQVR